MVLVGLRVELLDQRQVLLDRGIHHEHVDAALEAGSHHFPPLRLVAGLAGLAGAVFGQIFFAISFFQHALDLLRPDDRTVSRVLHAIHVYIQGNDVPLKGLILAQAYVVADHRTLFAGLAKPEFYRRRGTDARKVDRGMTGAGNSGHAGIERLVQNHAYIAIGLGTHPAQTSRHSRTNENRDRPESPLKALIGDTGENELRIGKFFYRLSALGLLQPIPGL